MDRGNINGFNRRTESLMQLPAKNARTDVIQRNVMLLIAAFMSCQGGVSDEAEGNRVCVSEDTKTSGKLGG